jgi:carbon-monoxide dehydrogenase small subunit
MLVEMTVNGEARAFMTRPDELLSDLLRREGYLGIKRGCQDGSCGTCTVLLDGLSVRACLVFAPQAEGHHVTTIEGLGTIDEPHPLQQSFVNHGAAQCGFCIPGMILSAKALLDDNPRPTVDDVKEALDGNLCRCTGYVKQLEAIMAAAEAMEKEGTP